MAAMWASGAGYKSAKWTYQPSDLSGADCLQEAVDAHSDGTFTNGGTITLKGASLKIVSSDGKVTNTFGTNGTVTLMSGLTASGYDTNGTMTANNLAVSGALIQNAGGSFSARSGDSLITNSIASNGTVTVMGPVVISGVETHSATETHSGSVSFNGVTSTGEVVNTKVTTENVAHAGAITFVPGAFKVLTPSTIALDGTATITISKLAPSYSGKAGVMYIQNSSTATGLIAIAAATGTWPGLNAINLNTNECAVIWNMGNTNFFYGLSQ
jgi:hypothetical protein